MCACVFVCASVAVDGFLTVFTYVACGLIESNKVHANARAVNVSPFRRCLSPARSMPISNATNKVRPKKSSFFFSFLFSSCRSQQNALTFHRSYAQRDRPQRKFPLYQCDPMSCRCWRELCVCIWQLNYVIASTREESPRQTSLLPLPHRPGRWSLGTSALSQ